LLHDTVRVKINVLFLIRNYHLKMYLINKSEAITAHNPPVSVKKTYTPPLLLKLDTHEIQGGSTSLVAENTAGSGGWIANGS
jgi:hypothetical protein